MKRGYLQALRLASPGAPSARELARKLKCSAQAVSMFEQGRMALSDAVVSKYAAQVGVAAEHVWHLFKMEALRYHTEQAKIIGDELRAHRRKGRKMSSVA